MSRTSQARTTAPAPPRAGSICRAV